MRASIKIDMDNAAFEEPGYELARILRELAQKCEDGWKSGPLHDINGNRVGTFKIVGGAK